MIIKGTYCNQNEQHFLESINNSELFSIERTEHLGQRNWVDDCVRVMSYLNSF